MLSIKEKKIVKKFATLLKKNFKDNIILIKLFGSKSRGDSKEDSDIDVLVVVKKKNTRVRDEIYELLFQLDPFYKYKISIILFSIYEYKKNEKIKTPFFKEIQKAGIDL
jgi:predicted nucleotidyltransferase